MNLKEQLNKEIMNLEDEKTSLLDELYACRLDVREKRRNVNVIDLALKGIEDIDVESIISKINRSIETNIDIIDKETKQVNELTKNIRKLKGMEKRL